ncbi:MAG TPA: hypothetical protein VFN37_05130 [Candidatus Baltobacteraceae bacterium]|nr:hypothetical protein [Candidatus Baltobacteraceae bacterium]
MHVLHDVLIPAKGRVHRPAPHHFRARPLLLLPIIAVFVSRGRAGPPAFAPAPIAPGSNPPPAGCPTPAPSH